MKRAVCFVIIILSAKLAMAAKPLFGIGELSTNSPRAYQMSLIFEERISSLIEETGRFSQINMPESGLSDFDCSEEKCLLRFASAAEMQALVLGSFDDRGDEMILDISAYGIDFPFNERKFYNYKISLPLSGALGADEYSYIFEEHAIRFTSGFLKRFSYMSLFKINNSRFELEDVAVPDGKYVIYRKGQGGLFSKVGEVNVSSGTIRSLDYSSPTEGDFVLTSYKGEASFLDDFMYGRKREIVFGNMSWDEKLYAALSIVPGSAVMPMAAPLAYFASADWPGLALWSVNALPYICLEIDGFARRLNTKYDMSRTGRSNYRFAWYMLVSGGGSLFVDAFAKGYIENAANYLEGKQPYMGSDFLAGYLALTTAGGCHFYKGYRFWGYLYFHTVNLLTYSLIREYTFHKDKRERLMFISSALGAVKLVEFIHGMLLPYRIENGKPAGSEENFTISPAISLGEDSNIIAGLQFVLKF